MPASKGNLHTFEPAKDRARAVRRELFKVLRMSLRSQGDDLAGFAMVLWDRRGEPDSNFLTKAGPIGRAMMPNYVKDALERHVTMNLTVQVLEDPPDESA